MTFLDTPRFPEDISFGSQGGPKYSTDIVMVSSGTEVRNQNWIQARHEYDVAFGVREQADLDNIIEFFHVAAGMAHEFRYKDWMDYSSASTPGAATTPTDVLLGVGDGSANAFQLVKLYDNGSGTIRSRDILKAVSGSALLAVAGVNHTQGFSISSLGVLSFTSTTYTITGVVLGATTVLNTSTSTSGLLVGMSLYISGISGTTELNSNRYVVSAKTSNTISIVVDSSGFTTYVSGGSGKTLPQIGEAVTAGFEFDIPVRFDTDHLSISLDNYQAGSFSVPLVEVKL